MANAYVLNQFPAGYGKALSLLTEMLFSAGWTYQGSGDGLASFSTSLKVFNNFTQGAANSWNNSSAWARMQDPSAIRELLFSHDNAGGIRIRYSPSAKFVGTFNGTVSATVPPTATDEKYIAGGLGTNYTPGSGPFFGTGTLRGASIYQGAAMSRSPYGFWFAGADFPRGQIRTGFMMEPVTSVPEDPDPYVFTVGGANCFQPSNLFYNRDGTQSANWSALPSSGTLEGSFAFMDTSRKTFLYVQAAGYCFGAVAAGLVMDSGVPQNPFNGQPEFLPVLYGRFNSATSSAGGNTQQCGVKGWGTFARWLGAPRSSLGATTSGKTHIAVGAVWLPWDGVTTPLA